jgi:hypothetical protein
MENMLLCLLFLTILIVLLIMMLLICMNGFDSHVKAKVYPNFLV